MAPAPTSPAPARAAARAALGARIALLASALALAASIALAYAPTAGSETIQTGNLIITVESDLAPQRLPRHGTAPVRVNVSGHISTTDGGLAPQLAQFELEVNRQGRLFDRGLPRCRRSQLRDTTTKQALRVCRGALVGHGYGAAVVALPDQSPFPAHGKVLLFNARVRGRPAVLGHVWGRAPVPVTTIVPFRILPAHRKPFGTRIIADLPVLASDWGYVSDFRLTIGRRYRHHGKRRSFLSAGCPAPKGFPGAIFDLARATYRFEDGEPLSTTLSRQCKVRGR